MEVNEFDIRRKWSLNSFVDDEGEFCFVECLEKNLDESRSQCQRSFFSAKIISFFLRQKESQLRDERWRFVVSSWKSSSMVHRRESEREEHTLSMTRLNAIDQRRLMHTPTSTATPNRRETEEAQVGHRYLSRVRLIHASIDDETSLTREHNRSIRSPLGYPIIR